MRRAHKGCFKSVSESIQCPRAAAAKQLWSFVYLKKKKKKVKGEKDEKVRIQKVGGEKKKASGVTGDVGIVSTSFASSAIYWRGLEADHRGTEFLFFFLISFTHRVLLNHHCPGESFYLSLFDIFRQLIRLLKTPCHVQYISSRLAREQQDVSLL